MLGEENFCSPGGVSKKSLLLSMPGPLDGVKVVDFCQYINGPSATGQLCENGATVLKIEPQSGEGMRHASGGPGVMHPGLEM